MSQTLYQLYRKKAIVLTRTMVIKFHSIAESINNDLRDRGYEVDELDPSTWKYYLNLNGEYHQADRDRLLQLSGGVTDLIQVKVAGDQKPVDADFTKDFLFGPDSDLAVANEYRFNTQYYNDLIAKYPEFESLILGVLNPIPPEISISAYDGEILYCGGYLKTKLPYGNFHYIRQDYGPISDNYLIEVNEENLIPILQDRISSFYSRWYNPNYANLERLFIPAFLGMLYLNIPQILSAVRVRNLKTPFTHSFHIREYLESNGQLGWVAEYLSKGVLLWLYRNLIWLDSNAGKEKTFDAIVENVLTPERIPLSEFRLRHDVSVLNSQQLYNDAYLESSPVNLTNQKSFTRHEIIDVIDREVQLATDNSRDQIGQANQIRETSVYSLFDNVKTRVYESTVIDYSNQIAVTKEEVALNLWLFTASRGSYRGTVIFTDPVTNARVQLTPLNAYILSLYCFNKGWADVELTTIPPAYASGIPRHPSISLGPDYPVKPTLAQVKQGVVSEFITDAEVKQILGTNTPKFDHRSTLSFSNEVQVQHSEAMRRYYDYTRLDDAKGRAMGNWVAHHCYWYDVRCELSVTPTLYADWLKVFGFDFTSYTREDYISLAVSVVQSATGVNLNAEDDLRNRQSAALAVLKHFSSYTLQLIQNTVANDSIWLDWQTVRVTDWKSSGLDESYYELPGINGDLGLSASDLISTDREMPVNNFEQLYNFAGVSCNVSFDIAANELSQKMSLFESLPGLNVLSMRLPQILTGNEVKVFSQLASTLYPVNVSDALRVTVSAFDRDIDLETPVFSVADDLLASNITLSNLEILPVMESDIELVGGSTAFNPAVTITPGYELESDGASAVAYFNPDLSVTPPIFNVSDDVFGSFSFDSMLISPPLENVTDNLYTTTSFTAMMITNENGDNARFWNVDDSALMWAANDGSLMWNQPI